MTSGALCGVLRNAFSDALRNIDVGRSVQAALASYPHVRSFDVIAVGKAAPIMLAGALGLLEHRVRRALVVTTDGTTCPLFDERVTVLRASHPVPDQRSTLAASAAASFASSCISELLLVLVSGGTSSLLCAPIDAPLEDYRVLTGTLLSAGASIRDVNTVRRHLSAIHGGRLAQASSVPVRTLILSDVIGGESHDVGSGPACTDPTTRRQAQRVLRRYLPPDLAEMWISRVRETPKPGSALSRRLDCSIIVGPDQLAHALATQLRARGFRCTSSMVPNARADQLVTLLLDEARRLGPHEAHVVSCEPTLQLPDEKGRGGRAGWVALSALLQLPSGTALLAGASDGIDGSSGSGGACVAAEHAALVSAARASIALQQCDDASVHRDLATHLPDVPTGLNLTDVYVVARA